MRRKLSLWYPIALLLMGLTLAGRATSSAGNTVPVDLDRWHFPTATQRALVSVRVASDDTPLTRPVRLSLDAEGGFAAAGALRAWDLAANREVAAQREDKQVLIAPGLPLRPGENRLFYLYNGPGTPAPAVVRLEEGFRVHAATYTATVDPRQGGALKSLQWKDGSRAVETLSDGVRWWLGRNPQRTQESFGAVTVERVSEGPLFTALRVTYPNIGADGNTFTVDYRFFRDFLEVDYSYKAATPATLDWLKIPVTLRAPGQTPGLYSNSGAQDQPMRTNGTSGFWAPDTRWHDVSYLGEQPFGMGVIARSLPGSALYYMDSIRPAENEWIYAEPFGWERPVQVKADFAVKLALVPHAAGKGRYQETLAKLDGQAEAKLSAVQARGGKPIDTDRDGLSDAAEWRLGTNPHVADTDADGIADGKDKEPLLGLAPQRRVNYPQFTAQPTTQPQTIAQVKPVGGVPTLVLDGKPYGPMMYTRCAATLEQLGEIGRRDFPLHFEMVGNVGWPGEQQDTLRQLDGKINRFLDQVPNARIILRLYVCAPPRFAKDYPEETMAFNDGAVNHFTKWYAMTNRPPAERGYPSFASEIWRQKTAEALYHYVTHVRRSDYSRNIIGYFVCGGGTEEWYYWHDYDQKVCTDFSKPMLRAFRDYLRARYGGDVRRLRAAWNDPGVDFATALPPDSSLRYRPDAGVFWDPAKSQRVRDYYYVHNKVMEDSLLIFARAVKQACKGEQLVGMFHGYLQNHWYLEGGQATLKELLRSPDVDFWAGPPQYNRRGQGEHGCIRFLPASLKAHGKLWISESDLRTNFSEPSPGNPSFHGRPPGLAESLACLKREYAHQLCEGTNGWWFQMGKTWYHHEPILSLFQQMQRNGEAAMRFERASDTDVAAVVDMESLRTGPAFPVSSSLLDAFKVQELCRIGTPVDYYELEDILAPGAKRYKLYLMLNCFSLDAQERRLIDERLRRHGATLVWMYAPGLFAPGRTPELNPAHARELLGFGIKPENGEALSPRMRLTEAGADYCAGFDPKRVFGTFERPEWKTDPGTGKVAETHPNPITLRQRFVGQEEGEVLARFEAGGQPAMVMRRASAATDIWIGSVMAPADLLRSLAKRAGCHLYCDADEIIYANRSFLAIHTRAEGERTFQLRRKSDVVEIFTGDALGEGATQFRDKVGAFETRVYFLGDRAQWQAERARADAFFAHFQEERARMEKERANQPRPELTPAALLKQAGPFPLDAQGYVTTVLFCGPFPNLGSGETATGYVTDYVGETTIRPRPGGAHPARFRAEAGTPEAIDWFAGKAGDKQLSNAWTAYRVNDPLPILKDQIPSVFTDQRIAYYVASYVELAKAQEVYVGIGSDDGYKLWVNGTPLGGANVSRGVGTDTNRFPVKMQAGRNLVLLKVIQGGGPTGWSLRLSDAKGAPLRGCRIWLDK